jgi:signal peptidase
VLSWFVMLTIGAVLLVAFVVPRLAGGTTYVVETGSMRPGLPPGTLVVVKPADPTDIAAGDVITYQLRSGDPTVVTHRVITVGYDGAGEVRWRTQGDANNTADANWVMPEQLKGRLWYDVPYVGYGTSVVTNQQRGLVIGLIALGLGGYAVVQLSGAWRERRRKQSTADVS